MPDWNDYKNKDARFEDTSFSHNKNSIYWGDMDEDMPEGLMGSELFWKRAFDVYQGGGRSLWGDGFSHEDINQGAIGNCWFLAAASAVAEKPERMAKIFQNSDKDLNRQGLYFMNFW